MVAKKTDSGHSETKKALTESAAWKQLEQHFQQIQTRHMRDLFTANPDRFNDFNIRLNDILLDYSKNRITEETRQLLIDLAKEAGVASWREKMFCGEHINVTEDRAVLHVALRNRTNKPMRVDGVDVMPDVNRVLEKMRLFSESVRSGTLRGYNGERFKSIVNIGIGGSDLGPQVVCESMKPFAQRGLNAYFVSNADSTHLLETLKRVEPESTLFVISSKSFTTQETMLNAESAKRWFLNLVGNHKAIAKHFVAVSNNVKAATEFGIDADNTFEIWDWVGGRYSLWSAIGLPIALYLGMDHFEELLAGAHDMDNHFKTAPLEENMPVIMAMLGIWYNNFYQSQSHAVMPYSQYLRRLPAYLQQLDMESNGKTIDRNGQRVEYLTGPIIWGEPGTNGQHAFFQLLHQGTKPVPADFIVPCISQNPLGNHHRVLVANCFAQTRALMHGKTAGEALAQMREEGVPDDEINELFAHKVFDGNKPTNTILFNKLTPKTLGSILALYEHKVFVQGIVWNINSFDQMGVEYGKQLAGEIQAELSHRGQTQNYDSSTNALINHRKNAYYEYFDEHGYDHKK
ncbi:MAG: glucose-6-phosphate isomerase [Gammaproteobacteria bacterium]|nr:glucose-6-phosphate isomerase [Gammaproteobacteria bacterium]